MSPEQGDTGVGCVVPRDERGTSCNLLPLAKMWPRGGRWLTSRSSPTPSPGSTVSPGAAPSLPAAARRSPASRLGLLFRGLAASGRPEVQSWCPRNASLSRVSFQLSHPRPQALLQLVGDWAPLFRHFKGRVFSFLFIALVFA